ncbi:MAG: hypothetical protein LBU82_04905 [Treponema sp.]|jgi:hypothetical protein|nr:hypothetical protein [Treponema sp.]
MSIINLTYQKTPKSIESFEIDVVLSESYGFANSVTDIPVEEGDDVNDHVVSQPPTVTIQAFIGRAKFQAWEGDIPQSPADLPSDDPKARIKQAYLELKRLTDEKNPLTLTLGLDTYKNMVITSFEIDRDVQTGADLLFTMSFKKVRVIKSKTTAINASSSAGGGGQTSGTANAGLVATKKVDPESGMMQGEWKIALNRRTCTRDEYLETCGKNGWQP